MSGYTYDPLAAAGPDLPSGDTDVVWTAKLRTEPAPALSHTNHGVSTLEFATREAGAVPAGQPIAIDFGPGPIFEGAVVATDLSFEGQPAELVTHHHAVDFAWDANARRPFGTWASVSATTIVLALMAAYAPGFTVTGVAAGLPAITLLLDGSQNLTDCLTAICTAMGGGSWYFTVKDLHLFQDPEVGTDPDVITATTTSFLHDPPATLSEDVTQIRTRVYGKGAGSVTRAIALAGDTEIEVGSLDNFESSGGLVLIGSQVVSYTGTRKSSEAARRAATAPSGAGGGMTLQPTVGGFGTPWDDGNLRTIVAYKISFVDRFGKESPLSDAATIPWIPPVSPASPIITHTSIGSAGFLDAGVYSYVGSYATATGETNGLAAGAGDFTVSAGPNGSVVIEVTAAHADPRVTGIHIFRTKAGGWFDLYQIGTVANTIGATLTDTLNDASLTSLNPNIAPRVVNTTGGKVYLSDLPPCPDPDASGPVQPSFGPLAGGTPITVTGRGFIAGLNVYVGGTIATAITFVNATTYTCTTPAHAAGTVDVEVGTAGDHASYLTLPEAFTYTDTDDRVKKLYRAEYDSQHLFAIVEPYELLATLGPDDLTYVDDHATRDPGIYDSPLDATDPDAAPVSGSTAATPPTWHYLLTGVPASGTGALTATVLVGTAVNIWVQRDDATAQAAFAARHGGSGIREGYVTNTSLRTAALVVRVEAELDLWKDPIRTVTYATRDPHTKVGRTVTFALTRPAIAGSFLIQQVHGDLRPHLTTNPLLTVTASSVRFTLEDLLRRVLLTDDGAVSSGGGTGGGGGGSGADGAQGPSGADGAAGAPGVSNIPGPMGPPGSDGEDGWPGPPGNPGTQGAAGVAGVSNVPGPMGPPGTDGDDGWPGPQGTPGTAGAAGSAGAAGLAGAPGTAGEDGEDGWPGPQGLPGAAGAAGALGSTGPGGAPGYPGEDGEDGWPGAAGPAGHPITIFDQATEPVAAVAGDVWITDSPTAFTFTTTGNVDDLDFSNADQIRCNNATLTTIRGLKAGSAGQRVTLVSVGAGQVDLAHQSASDATAANRLINAVTSASTSLAAGVGTATYQYDATTARWRLLEHVQGAAIAAAYVAGNFTGSASQTWTVDSGDVLYLLYTLVGRALMVQLSLTTTTVGGTVDYFLLIGNGAWGGFTATKSSLIFGYGVDNSVFTRVLIQTNVPADNTKIYLAREDVAKWTLSANATQVQGTCFFGVD